MDICVIIRGFLCFNIFCTLLLMLLFHIREGSKFSNGLQVQTIQTGDLDDKQSKLLSAIPKLLVELRKQMVPYPNEYFYGRGIVLTVGIFQLSFAKVNLKMIELSNTRLPIEVTKIWRITKTKKCIIFSRFGIHRNRFLKTKSWFYSIVLLKST